MRAERAEARAKRYKRPAHPAAITHSIAHTIPMRYLLSILFAFSTLMDFLTTFAIMRGQEADPPELNPIAKWLIIHHGWTGLAWSIVAIDVIIIAILLRAWRRNERSAALGFGVACIASNTVVIHNLLVLIG